MCRSLINSSLLWILLQTYLQPGPHRVDRRAPCAMLSIHVTTCGPSSNYSVIPFSLLPFCPDKACWEDALRCNSAVPVNRQDVNRLLNHSSLPSSFPSFLWVSSMHLCGWRCSSSIVEIDIAICSPQ